MFIEHFVVIWPFHLKLLCRKSAKVPITYVQLWYSNQDFLKTAWYPFGQCFFQQPFSQNLLEQHFLMPVPPQELFQIDLAKNCTRKFQSKFKHKFLQNFWLPFFNQCLSQLFSTCEMPIGCLILCIFPATGKLVRGSCQYLLNYGKRLDQQTRYLLSRCQSSNL